MDDKKLKLLEKDLTDTDLEFYLKQELVALGRVHQHWRLHNKWGKQ